MGDKIIRKKNKGNYSYVIAKVCGNDLFQVIKYVKTRGKNTTGKTKRRIVFDEALTSDQILTIDNGILKDVLIDLIKGDLNES